MQTQTAIPSTTRGLSYFFAFFSAKHLGAGQYYLMTIKDKQGQPLEGSGDVSPQRSRQRSCHSILVRHRLRPRHPRAYPQHAVAQPRLHHIRTAEEHRRLRGPLLRPQALPPGKESNWVPTDPNGKFEVLFRFYGPQKPLFDKTWKLPDIEKVN